MLWNSTSILAVRPLWGFQLTGARRPLRSHLEEYLESHAAWIQILLLCLLRAQHFVSLSDLMLGMTGSFHLKRMKAHAWIWFEKSVLKSNRCHAYLNTIECLDEHLWVFTLTRYYVIISALSTVHFVFCHTLFCVKHEHFCKCYFNPGLCGYR